MLLVKPSTVVVLSLLAASRRAAAAPYDSYPTYPTDGVTISDPTPASNSDESNNRNPLSGLEAGLQRVWEGITCMSECRKTWGWTGNHFGADPWGGVLKPGDPAPYVPEPSNVNANADASESQAETATTSSTGVFGVLDVTTTARGGVTFSVFNVPTLFTSTSTTSTTPTSTPPPETTSQEPSPTPEPQPETTQEQQQQAPPERPTTNNTPQQPAPTNDNNSAPGLNADQAFMLSAHNNARAAHGAAPVTWSTQLEGFAQTWANNCEFEHSEGKFGRVGENLAAGTGNYGFAEAMKGWMDEVKDYNPSAPVASHFTQVVWKGTSQIGCAKAVCNGIFEARFGAANYYVCEYLEAGNVNGQFGANVQK